MNNQKIFVDGTPISIKKVGDLDYVCLTDIAQQSSDNKPAYTIQNWMRNRATLLFIKTWETLYNPKFKVVQMDDFIVKSAENRFALSPKLFIEQTEGISLLSKMGRLGGTYAHSDLALNFCYWLSPVFQVYFIHEFQRLKKDEAILSGKEWSINRYLSKMNYHIQSDSVRENLIGNRAYNKASRGLIYANEADVLNMAVFGITAKEWRIQNHDKQGNIRDHATNIQLHVLANLETLNAKFIEYGMSQKQRITELNDTAAKHFDIIKEYAKKIKLKNK